MSGIYNIIITKVISKTFKKSRMQIFLRFFFRFLKELLDKTSTPTSRGIRSLETFFADKFVVSDLEDLEGLEDPSLSAYLHFLQKLPKTTV